ncbi:hypothetical protein PoB_000820600 [Plakobranchus ocellatus]|uniref:Uncharacterized protein n=1 Tax=Plakobranchus ocellatus TaxID=259542 RepID=A0AAV3YH60_9GAST|nr:hypothetical protein PoB_000820600 [Plakobranchus ocellatus]
MGFDEGMQIKSPKYSIGNEGHDEYDDDNDDFDEHNNEEKYDDYYDDERMKEEEKENEQADYTEHDGVSAISSL